MKVWCVQWGGCARQGDRGGVQGRRLSSSANVMQAWFMETVQDWLGLG